MGSLANEFLYRLNPPFFNMRKKVKVFVVEPNSTYETEYVLKDSNGKLVFYSDPEKSSRNPKVISDENGNVSLGTKNVSTGQPAYVWFRGEQFAYPMAIRDTIARAEDEDAMATMLIEHGKLIERGKWQKADSGIDKTRQIMIIVCILEILIGIGIWQILGALK